MRWFRRLPVFFAALLLTGCLAPALLLGNQSQILGELLRPLVGFNPLDVKLFENPLIKDRMVALMGEENYRTATTLLYTATELQMQGPLFFVTSKHSPLPHLAEKAGFVWNKEHNQMAILLVSGGKTEIFTELVHSGAKEIIPSWPDELLEYTKPENLKQKAAQAALDQLGLEGSSKALTEAALSGGSVQNMLETEAKAAVLDPIEEITQKVQAGNEALLAEPKARFEQVIEQVQPSEEDIIRQFTGKSLDELEKAKAVKDALKNTQKQTEAVLDAPKKAQARPLMND